MNSILQLANTFPGFVLTSAVRAFALGFLCAVGLWLFRVRNSAIQYAVWRLILFAMLAMPLALAVMPAIGFPRLPAIQVATQIARLPSLSHPEQKKQFPSVEIEAAQVAGSAQSSVFTVPWALIGLAFSALVAGTLISRIVLGRSLMNRLAGRMERLDDPRLLERVNHQCETLGLLIFPEVRAGETVTVPVTFGWKNPTVLLARADKLDLVLAHELSHVQRGDYLIRIASTLNKSLYWFHPLSWWLDKRLTELGEHLSDDAALAAVSARRERYAEILGDFAGLLGHSLNRFKISIAMSVAAPGSPRIKRILDHQRRLCSNLNHWQKLAAFSLGISALVLVAGAQTAQVQAPRPIRPTEPVVSGPDTVPQRPRRVPPPMFSRAYGDALQGILELERSGVTALEHQLEENPKDFAARLKLIAYCMRADRAGLPESRSRRAGLVLWLVDHQPDSEILGSPYGVLSPGDLTAGQLTQARQWWEAAMGPGQSDARIFWNAANFYQQLDRPLYIASLEKAVALAPDNERYALPLGLLYAGAILTVNPQSMYRDPSGADPEFARHAGQILGTTQNPYILEPAVRLLKSEYNRSLMMARESASIGALAQQYFQRAKTLDPNLDQVWIYPQIDPKMIGIFAPGAPPPDEGRLDFETAAKQIRRLPADAFQALPSMIREEIRSRGCMIPQQTFSDGWTSNQLQNVVQGEFFEREKPVGPCFAP